LQQIGDLGISFYGVAAVGRAYEYGSAARSFARFDISPAITDHNAVSQQYVKPSGSVNEHARLWFSAPTFVGIVVIAASDFIYRQLLLQPGVHRLDGRAVDRTACHVRLVRHDDEREARIFEAAYGISDTRQELKLRNCLHGYGHAAPHVRPNERPVAIQKDGWTPALAYRTDSHLVGARFKRGWDTIRCQTIP
jgi:hypothetical protein